MKINTQSLPSKTILYKWQGFQQRFQQEGNRSLRMGKTFWTELLYTINFPLDDQTRWAKPSSQLVNLPSAWLLIKPLESWWLHPSNWPAMILPIISIRHVYAPIFNIFSAQGGEVNETALNEVLLKLLTVIIFTMNNKLSRLCLNDSPASSIKHTI